jgi:hypothetical protein
MKNHIFFGLTLFLFQLNCFALDDEKVNLEALTQTQNLLKDSEQRNAVVKQSEGAKKADEVASTVSIGDANAKNSIYEIAADVMPWLISQTEGDPAKMLLLLENAKKDPKAFFNSLPEVERKKIQNLGNFLESKRAPSKAAPSP